MRLQEINKLKNINKFALEILEDKTEIKMGISYLLIF